MVSICFEQLMNWLHNFHLTTVTVLVRAVQRKLPGRTDCIQHQCEWLRKVQWKHPASCFHPVSNRDVSALLFTADGMRQLLHACERTCLETTGAWGAERADIKVLPRDMSAEDFQQTPQRFLQRFASELWKGDLKFHLRTKWGEIFLLV